MSMVTVKSMADRHAWLVLLALTLVLYLPGTGSIPLMDRDEPRFAHATMEMMQRGEWLVPYFNGEYRFDKPPLTYWWMRLHYQLLGFNELAARLHSVVAVWLVALVVFRMGSRLSGRSSGWWAAAGWLTCLQAMVHGRLCVADMPMVLCVTLAMAALTDLLGREEPPSSRFGGAWWLLWSALGAGFLAKGPVALLVPALALALWRFVFWRRPAPWSRLQAGWGALLAFLIVAAWGVPALLQTQGLFWKVGMGEHVVKRGTQAFNGRVVLPFYYFATAFLSLLPWIAFFPGIWRKVRAGWDARVSLLTAWFAAPYLIFLFYATQLPHYVMPGFPGFFLLFGAAMGSEAGGRTLELGRFGQVFLASFAILAVTVMTLAWGTSLVPQPALRWVLTAGAGLLLGLVFLGFSAGRRWRAGMAVSLLVSAACLAPFGVMLRQAHPLAQLLPVLRALPPGAELVAWRFTEPSLVFYADQPWIMLSRLERVQERLDKGRVDAVILLRREWTLRDRIAQLRQGTPSVPSQDSSREVDELTTQAGAAEVHDVSGYNLARSSWVEIRLLVLDRPSRPE